MQLQNDYVIHELPGAEMFTLPSGRWQYVELTTVDGTPVTRRYLHLDCDCIVDGEGRCILCRARAWT